MLTATTHILLIIIIITIFTNASSSLSISTLIKDESINVDPSQLPTVTAGVNLTSSAVNKSTCEHLAISEGAVIRLIMGANYSKIYRPVYDSRKPVVVKLGLRLLGIQDFVERENTLVLNAYLTMNWIDEGLIWNASFPEQCVPTVSLPANLIWLPDLVLLNAANRGESGYTMLLSEGGSIKGTRAILTSDGSVDIEPLTRLSISCDIDLMFFPFDSQKCLIRFESWSYPVSMQRLEVFDPAFVRNNKMWTENEHWLVTGNATLNGADAYGDGTAYDYVIFELHLQRKALFFYVNIIIPCLVISIVEIVIFALPIVEVIKIHISFTCLLAYTVFQTMSISDMPKSGDSVPLMSMYIAAGQANISMALFGEALVFIFLSKAQMKKSNVSTRLFTTFRRLGKIVGVSYWTTNEPASPGAKVDKGESTAMLKSPTTPTEENAVTKKHGFAADKDEPCHTKLTRRFILNGYDNEWLYVAEVAERCTAITYICSICITPIIVFIVVPFIAKLNRHK